MGGVRVFPSCLAAVRTASGLPFERLLHAEHERVGGEPGVDAAHRRAVSPDAVLRCAAHDVAAQPGRLRREPQARRTADERDGPTGDAAGSAHEPAANRARKVPVFTGRNEDLRAMRGVEFGHHVHSHAARIHVPRCGDGLVQPLRDRVGPFQQYGKRVLRCGAREGVAQGPSADAYSDDSALLFRRKAPGSSEGFGPGFPSDCGHVFRVNRPFCTGRIGA